MPVYNGTGNTAVKIPIMPPLPQNSASLNPEDITLFTSMFLNLFKGIGDWRNQVAVDTVQSVWQSPPVVDFSHRLFGT
ncbi:GH22225 [Drosophila grimshawi]|uniref:GH22225 n=1 Tax=Drosophila grimshawi TaxID=7222 RepID=B4K411_DROGR|nr:GH22225 [Drosophila grimshawi]